ncbi:Endonuclease, Uma2 family (restriction endonuclease fold) [Candidatus Fervidibacteria bacterium JGI MDM2 JNZ-1-D12]
MVNTAVVEAEVLEEKMPESPWHNENVRQIEDLLREATKGLTNAVVFRDLFFRFGGKQYAPDLAVVVGRTPPLESIGLVYRVPEDGDAPAAIVEIAVSPKSLGEALSEKAAFYAAMGVKDYLVVEAIPSYPMKLWFCRLAKGEEIRQVREAILESLDIKVWIDGQKVRMADLKGNEILSLKEALERERQKREELERRVAELEQRLKEKS